MERVDIPLVIGSTHSHQTCFDLVIMLMCLSELAPKLLNMLLGFVQLSPSFFSLILQCVDSTHILPNRLRIRIGELDISTHLFLESLYTIQKHVYNGLLILLNVHECLSNATGEVIVVLQRRISSQAERLRPRFHDLLGTRNEGGITKSSIRLSVTAQTRCLRVVAC